MPRLSPAVSVALWSFPTLFLCTWMPSRIVAYFTKSLEWNEQDFANTVLPQGVHPSISDGFNRALAIFFDPSNLKYVTVRAHIAMSVAMGFICLFQLMPFLRARFLRAHRLLGYAYVALLVPFTTEQVFTLFIRGMVPISDWLVVGNTISLIAMVGGTAVGVWAAKNHNLRLHRAAMLVNAAGLYINPAQRVFWVLFSKNHLGGPYSSWPAWVRGTMDTAELAATLSCFLTALLYITVVTPGWGRAKKLA